MKVSIVTVCLNSRSTLGDTIRSVLEQDYAPIEYVVVDGGSTDGTHDVLDRHRDRIDVCISEPDRGIYDGMNKGIRSSSGDVIGFLNSDDVYADRGVIRTVVENLQSSKADCCYGDLDYVDGNGAGRRIRKWRSQPYRENLFEKGWHPPHPTFFARASVFHKYGFFDDHFRIGSDYELMLRFLRKHRISSCYIPTVLVKMRIGGKSNRRLSQIVRANIECYQAWKKNGLRVSPFIMLRKPLSKVVQYLPSV